MKFTAIVEMIDYDYSRNIVLHVEAPGADSAALEAVTQARIRQQSNPETRGSFKTFVCEIVFEGQLTPLSPLLAITNIDPKKKNGR